MGLEKVPGVLDKAKETAGKAVEKKKDTVVGFIEEVSQNLDQGFPKMGNTLLKTAKSACDEAVEDVRAMIPNMCGCMKIPSADEVKVECFEKVTTEMKAMLKKTL